jgi:hypothetical protein
MERLNVFKIILIFIGVSIIQILMITFFTYGIFKNYPGFPSMSNLPFKIFIYSPWVYWISVRTIFDLFLGYIASGMAKKENENRFLWFLFTAIFGISGIAILYLKIILKRVNKILVYTKENS